MMFCFAILQMVASVIIVLSLQYRKESKQHGFKSVKVEIFQVLQKTFFFLNIVKNGDE